jgi:hypothetical protein
MQQISMFAILLLTLLIGFTVFHYIFTVFYSFKFYSLTPKKKDSNECCASQNLLQSGNYIKLFLTLSIDPGQIIK